MGCAVEPVNRNRCVLRLTRHNWWPRRDWIVDTSTVNRPFHHRWSWGHKAWGQEHKKISRPKLRTNPLEAQAKDTDASVLKKKALQKFFSGDLKKRSSKIFFRRKRSSKFFFSGDLYLRKPKKRSLQIFRKVSGVYQRNFNGSKIVLTSSRGQGYFRGLEASRPRTSKCVLEDSTSTFHHHHPRHFNSNQQPQKGGRMSQSRDCSNQWRHESKQWNSSNCYVLSQLSYSWSNWITQRNYLLIWPVITKRTWWKSRVTCTSQWTILFNSSGAILIIYLMTGSTVRLPSTNISHPSFSMSTTSTSTNTVKKNSINIQYSQRTFLDVWLYDHEQKSWHLAPL